MNSKELTEKVMTALINVAKDNAVKSDEDYIEDGLKFCGKCRSPKECKISFLGSEAIVPCLCECGLREREEEKVKFERSQIQIEKDRKRAECFDNKTLWGYTFDACEIKDTQMYKTAEKYAENFEVLKDDAQGLLFFGNVGYGKTYIAASIANALIDKGYSCYMGTMANIASIMSSGRDEVKREFYKSIKEYDLFIIDDLGAERDTSYMDEMVYTVIDRRYHSHLPTIVTTNMDLDELKKPQTAARKRILSRLYEMCIFVEVKGKDRRRVENMERYNKYKDLLGLPGKE